MVDPAKWNTYPETNIAPENVVWDGHFALLKNRNSRRIPPRSLT